MTEMIKKLNSRYCCGIDIPMLSTKYPQTNVVQKKPVRKSENVIVPDKTYVNRLIRYHYVIDIPILSAKYLQKPVVQKKPVIQKMPVRKQKNVIIPDETYVNRLIEELKRLNGILGAREYNYCMKKLEEILQDGDFDDSEDIMMTVHEALEKYIYRSDTKVRNADWKLLEEYLIKAGYEPVPVKKGDRIGDYVLYFENVFPASDKGIKGTIKIITQRPYIITYLDGNEPLKLCGKCTVYQ